MWRKKIYGKDFRETFFWKLEVSFCFFRVADLCLKFRTLIRVPPLKISRTPILMIYSIKFLLVILPALIRVAFITLLERKLLGLVGLRVGPNKTSFIGILQPISDALKLSNKHSNSLSNISFFFYYIRAGFILFSSLLIWSCISLEPILVSWKIPVMVVLLCLAFNSFNSIISGWRTFRKYSLIGTVRTVSQLISYEAVLYMLFFLCLFFFSSFSFSTWNFLGFIPLLISIPFAFYIWIPTVLAELNRTPYDFSEGERELVRGFNTEFGSRAFTLIFLAEYRNIIFLSLLTRNLFFHEAYFLAFIFMFMLILWVRSALPRFRFDKLMNLAWKVFIPLRTLIFLINSMWIF